MELTFKKDFDLTKNTIKHKVVLDAIELLKTSENFTEFEITSMLYLAILINACEENVLDWAARDEGMEKSWEKYETVIEPKALEVVKDNVALINELVSSIYSYKERELDINGKFFYAVRELIKQLGDLDTTQISDILVAATSLRNTTKEIAKTEKKEQEVEIVNEKMQNLINKFKTAN